MFEQKINLPNPRDEHILENNLVIADFLKQKGVKLRKYKWIEHIAA